MVPFISFFANVEFSEADILKVYNLGLPRIFVITGQMSLN